METIKRTIVLEGPVTSIDIPQKVLRNIIAVKVRWLAYDTVSLSNTLRILRVVSNLGDTNMHLYPNKNNITYFLQIPLDRQPEVANVYTNYTSEWDLKYSEPKNINVLEFKAYFNDELANEITPTHPIVMELSFLKA